MRRCIPRDVVQRFVVEQTYSEGGGESHAIYGIGLDFRKSLVRSEEHPKDWQVLEMKPKKMLTTSTSYS